MSSCTSDGQMNLNVTSSWHQPDMAQVLVQTAWLCHASL
jgi:hypothetical protein